MEKIQGPHDKIFKRVMSDRENVTSLLGNILPEAVRKHLVLEEIFYEKDSFVPGHLSEYYADLLTSVPVRGGGISAKIYFLFEHKSFGGHNTPIQMLRYMLEIWDKYDRDIREAGDKLPMIIPVIIAHARDGWEYKKLSDFIEFPSEDFKAYVPDFDFVLYDAITENPDDYEFIETLKALLLVWRHYYRPDFIEHLVRVFRFIYKTFPEVKFKDFVITLMEYLSAVRGEEEYIDIEKAAKAEFQGGDQLMGTIAEMFMRKGEERAQKRFMQEKPQWVQEGRQEGREEGRQEGKIEATQETLLEVATEQYGPLPSVVSERIKAIRSLENLRALTRKAIKTESLEEFTDLVNRAADN